jgi:outer membrane lipoprotein-sorting protein
LWDVGLGIWVLGFLLSACAARRLTLPSDTGTPLPDFAAIHSQLSTACSGVRTLTAELGMSGRAGDQRLSGRIIAGFERPASMRLEAVGPLGRRGFTLAARDGSATLLIESDSRIVRNETPEAILGALTGVTLAPADLQAILTGCVVPSPRATAGRLHANGWASIDLDAGASVYLERQAGQWRLRAGRRNGWQIEYTPSPGAFPQAVRLQSTSADVAVDLTTSISELVTNEDIDPAAFRVDAPADARPLTLDELRQAGPLRGN